MSALDDARALVEQLEAEARLVKDMEDAANAHESDPSSESYSAHNRAQEALFDHWRQNRAEGALTVGGDAVASKTDNADGAE